MSELTKFQRMSNFVRDRAKECGVSGRKAGLAADVHGLVTRVLGQCNAVIPKSSDGLGIESFDTPVVRNKQFDVLNAFPVDALIQGLKDLNVPHDRIPDIAHDAMRTLNGETSPKAIVRDMPTGSAYAPLSQMVGRTASGMVNNEDLGVEAWGEDIDSVASDDRVTLELLIMRPFTSMPDRAFARVPVDDNVITVRVPNPEVYDWLRTQSGTALDRNLNNRIIMRDLYRDSSTVNSAPQQMIPQAAADKNGVLWNGTTYLKTGVSSNMFDLCMISNKFGYDHADRSDLISEGGRVKSVIVSLTSGDTTEYFKVETGAFKRSGYVKNPTGGDSGDRQVIMPLYMLVTNGDKDYQGNASTLATAFANSTVKISAEVTSTLSLKFGGIRSSFTLDTSIVPNTAGAAVADAENTAFEALSAKIVAFEPDLYFDEENYRKSNLAIWVNYNQNMFVIPRSRNYFTEYQLNQNLDQNAVQATSSIMTLGNSDRALHILVDALNDVAEAVTFAARNTNTASVNQLDETSFVSSLVKPLVLTTVLDYSDEPVNVMNESTRPYELHGRFRARIMAMLAELYAKSLMINQYKAGEKVVLKAFAHSAIADVLIGVMDYNPDYNDITRGQNGADYSLTLPNGFRLDVVKTTFDCLVDRIVVVPVREDNAADLTSAAQIVDRGTASAIYAPTNYGATVKRVVSTTREILMVTNPIGLIIKVQNVQKQLGTFDTTPIPFAPSTNDFSALKGIAS